jgi:sensor histidine kinase YesM
MEGLFSSRRGMAVYLTVWLFLGAALGGVIRISTDSPVPNAMLFALPVNLFYAFATGYSAYYLCRAYPLGSPNAQAIPLVFSVAAVMSGFLWLAIAQTWNGLCQAMQLWWLGIEITRHLSALIVALGMLLYGLTAAVHYLVNEFVRAKNAEQRELQSQLMAQEAELRMLRTQIDPHFLFNSLNSISALTSQDPKGARRMTLELASFFRQSLGMEAHKLVTLEQELVLIQHFLAIEKVRFGERLLAEVQVAEDAAVCLVPPMIIQPLVENAVKHGICNLPEGGCVSIAARRSGSVLHIEVHNAMDPDAGGARGAGIGLANVRQRLAGAYKHEASLHVEAQGGRFSVRIAMPAQTADNEE